VSSGNGGAGLADVERAGSGDALAANRRACRSTPNAEAAKPRDLSKGKRARWACPRWDPETDGR